MHLSTIKCFSVFLVLGHLASLNNIYIYGLIFFLWSAMKLILKAYVLSQVSQTLEQEIYTTVKNYPFLERTFRQYSHLFPLVPSLTKPSFHGHSIPDCSVHKTTIRVGYRVSSARLGPARAGSLILRARGAAWLGSLPSSSWLIQLASYLKKIGHTCL